MRQRSTGYSQHKRNSHFWRKHFVNVHLFLPDANSTSLAEYRSSNTAITENKHCGSYCLLRSSTQCTVGWTTPVSKRDKMYSDYEPCLTKVSVTVCCYPSNTANMNFSTNHPPVNLQVMCGSLKRCPVSWFISCFTSSKCCAERYILRHIHVLCCLWM